MPIVSHELELPFACADGEEIFCVGDVHGLAKELDELLAHAASIPMVDNHSRVIVFDGDLIDRGPKSLCALDLAIGAKDRIGADRVIGVLGNHCQMLKIALIDEDDPISIRAADVWIRNGGGNVIAELVDENPGRKLDVPAALGPKRIAWLDSLISHYVSGQIMFVHAGLNPAIPLDKFLAADWRVDFRREAVPRFQEAHHWAWVREPFLNHMPAAGEGHHGFFVVHGHTKPDSDTVSINEQVRRYRLNVDGGSYDTGEVRMVRIVGNRATLFMAHA